MAGIFISYRRGVAASATGRLLYDRLVAHFGAQNVFMDVDTLKPGMDFLEQIELAVASSDALLAVIDPDWVDAEDETGRRRLDDPLDYVRLELEAAIDNDIRLIPVLVHGALMPPPEKLPDSLKALSRRHASVLTHDRWDSDIAPLVNALEELVDEAERRAAAERKAAEEEAERRAAAEEAERKAAEERAAAEQKAAEEEAERKAAEEEAERRAAAEEAERKAAAEQAEARKAAEERAAAVEAERKAAEEEAERRAAAEQLAAKEAEERKAPEEWKASDERKPEEADRGAEEERAAAGTQSLAVEAEWVTIWQAYQGSLTYDGMAIQFASSTGTMEFTIPSDQLEQTHVTAWRDRIMLSTPLKRRYRLNIAPDAVTRLVDELSNSASSIRDKR